MEAVSGCGVAGHKAGKSLAACIYERGEPSKWMKTFAPIRQLLEGDACLSMELKDSGSVILKSYLSYGPSRIYLAEDTFSSAVSHGHSSINKKVCCLGTARMNSEEATHASPRRCSASSQEAPPPMECCSMEDYWSERKSIEEEGSQGGNVSPLERRSMDEAEMEEAWLKDAGLSTLVSDTPGDPQVPAEALLSTLTRSQAALVRKRMDNYTQTLRNRNRQCVRHVRDVFPGVPGHDPGVGEVPSPKPQVPPKHPVWMPVRGGEGRASITQQRTETLSFEQPYSEAAAAHKRDGECRECRALRNVGGEMLFQPPRPKLGLTDVQDLSSEDMAKIGCIALIELTTFYDCLGIELKQNRTLIRHKAGRESGIFGVSLVTLLENDRKILPGSRVPLVFRKLLSKLEQTGLQTEGILRIPGSVSRVKHLRQQLEASFYEDRFDWEQVRQNDAAGLLKTFIRELPSPLLTQRYLPTFTSVLSISSQRHQIQALHLLIMLLPEPHRDTLKALLEFLRKVVAHEERNRMSLCNVSMIVAPNLFISRGKTGRPEEIQAAAKEAYLVRLLITHQDLLWRVPCFLIGHIRQMNEASMNRKTMSSEKCKKKLLRRRQPERNKGDRSELTDFRDGVIRVHAPQHAKVSMAIRLDSETKARDVVARFHSETSRGSRSASRRHRAHLFEVGGNIGERCLDPETYLLDLHHVNPNCEWILKPRTA
ncbi:rho GTPase-activating protein 18-like isoform X2 [Paramormyrops kingsleyae]|uniref:rho GTPase-activating protein 18-like isoform X2 n=1 Tax=Paramormyrops kingsleyae TaxID=1676925 RepID=UPI003B97347F